MDLITACEHNNQEEVEYYLNQHPEDLNKTFKKHFEEATPLYFAAQYGHLGIVNLLLKKGANADLCCTKKKRIPLHVACFSGFVNVIKFLAKKTSDVNLPDSQGLTPFHLACQSGTQSCVEAIISGGCNVYAQDSLGRTGLDLLLHEDNLKIVRVLLSRYPDLIEKQSQEGRNSFHYASQVGALVCLRHMIQYFRDRALATDNEGRLPVHFAALHGHAPVVKEFLAKGIFQVNEADSFCRTVAHHAAKSSSFETLHITLEHNADLTIQDRNGNTVQHLACMNKPVPEMLICLKNHGADFDTLENETHDTPLYSARKAANLHNLEKALRDELKCRHCEEREAKEQREASRRRLTVHKKISDHGIGLYESSLPNTSRSMLNTGGRSGGVLTDRPQDISLRNGTQSKSGRNSNFIDDVDHYMDNKKNAGNSHGNRTDQIQNGGNVSNRHGNNRHAQNTSNGNRSYRNQNGGNVSSRHGDVSARDAYEMSPGQRDLVSRLYGEHSIFMVYKEDTK